jgi:hypothetical protein
MNNWIQLDKEYASLMLQAQNAANRQDAIELINKATAVKTMLDLVHHNPPSDRYSRWCGGKAGFDDYAERLH